MKENFLPYFTVFSSSDCHSKPFTTHVKWTWFCDRSFVKVYIERLEQ